MMTYSDAEIDDAIDRIAGDIERRSEHHEFHGAAVAAALDEVRRMEVARRNGDLSVAAVFATTAGPGLAHYRPTNATSRSKAVLVEVITAIIASNELSGDV